MNTFLWSPGVHINEVSLYMYLNINHTIQASAVYSPHKGVHAELYGRLSLMKQQKARICKPLQQILQQDHLWMCVLQKKHPIMQHTVDFLLRKSPYQLPMTC